MMSQEPSFPADAFGSRDAAPASPPPPSIATTVPPADDASDDAGGELSGMEAVAAIEAVRSKIWPAAGVAIGIGSAAVAAALLYRSRR